MKGKSTEICKQPQLGNNFESKRMLVRSLTNTQKSETHSINYSSKWSAGEMEPDVIFSCMSASDALPPEQAFRS